MWQSFSVGKKIFICLTAIGLGFAALMAFVIARGLSSQVRLSNVTSSSFPGAQKSQAIAAAFEQQTKAYQEAVTAGNTSALEVAKERGAFALQALSEIASMQGLGKPILELAATSLSSLKSYIAEAEPIYTAMAGGKMDQMEKAATLNQQATELKKSLNHLSKKLSDSLNQDIFSVQNTSRQQLVASGIAFLWLLGTSVGLVLLIRAIIQPLVNITEAAHRISAGDVNQRVDYCSGDEIGKLAEAFRAMLSYIRGVAEAADALTSGDLDVQITAKSEKDLLSKNFLRMAGTLRQMAEETSQLTQAAQAGTLGTRGDAARFHGAFAGIIRGFNETLDAFTTPINEASRALDQLAQKDLTVRMQGHYLGDFAHIKDGLNKAVGNLEDSMHQVLLTSELVSAAASQISNGSDSLAQGSSEQASSLEEVSASLQETASMAQKNAVNAKQACAMAEEARKVSTMGMENMRKLSESIQMIKTSSDKTARIVKTIDEIAFQTNLLALNAAVEAARAGDAGKGFAVVAEEVRNLAMRSAQAAKSTAELIEESVKNSDGGVRMNQEVLGNLDNINQQVNKVNEVMAEIAASSEQQKMGVTQITEAVEQMNRITQQVAANAEESASSAKELSSQAAEMQSMVGSFRLGNLQHESNRIENGQAKEVELVSHISPRQLLPSILGQPKNGHRRRNPAQYSDSSVLGGFNKKN
jgi:methyl-accepting chemotaxis protein